MVEPSYEDMHNHRVGVSSTQNPKRFMAVPRVLPAQVDHILRLFRAYEQATTSTTVRGSWMRTGFQYEETADTRYLTVNEAAIRSSPGFQEICQFDSVLDRLSARRRSQKWGWINQHLFHKKEIQCF
jgi:hypothetical protein